MGSLLVAISHTFVHVQRSILTWLPTGISESEQNRGSSLRTSALILFLVAIYGGFYGLGISFLLLAVLRLLGLEQIQQLNGLKVLLMSCNTVAATLMFVPAGVINWNQAFFIMVGSTIGGYAGA